MLSSTPDIHIYSQLKKDYSLSITDEYFKSNNNRLVIVHHPKPANTKKNLKNSSAVINDIRKNKNVAAVSPVLAAQIFFNYGTVQLNGIIDGVDINEETRILNIKGKIVEGSTENLNKSQDRILLGQGLAENLNVHAGDMVTAITGLGLIKRFHVAGIFNLD